MSETEARRSFTEEFKHDAVRLATKRGNVSAVARDLEIHESVLNRWKRQLQQETERPGSQSRPFPGRGNARDEELAKFQRENARLRQENESLKRQWVSSPKPRGEIRVHPIVDGALLGRGSPYVVSGFGSSILKRLTQ